MVIPPEDSKLFICPYCDKQFSTRFSRNRHQRHYCTKAMNIDAESQESENPSSSHSGDESLRSSCSSSKAESEPDCNTSVNSDESLNSDSSSKAQSESDSQITCSRSGSEGSEVDASHASSDQDSISNASGDSDMELSDSDEEFVVNPFDDLVNKTLHSYEKAICRDGNDLTEASNLRRQFSKSLRRNFTDYFLHLHAKKQDPLFQNIMKKIKSLRKKGFSSEEAIRAAVAYWKHPIENIIPF